MLHRFAFLPLISDPEGRDKSRLFHDLESETEVELAADNPHPPIFACVMRRQGSHKQLECHGFVCNSSEDAIIIAANLYQVKTSILFKKKPEIILHTYQKLRHQTMKYLLKPILFTILRTRHLLSVAVLL